MNEIFITTPKSLLYPLGATCFGKPSCEADTPPASSIYTSHASDINRRPTRSKGDVSVEGSGVGILGFQARITEGLSRLVGIARYKARLILVILSMLIFLSVFQAYMVSSPRSQSVCASCHNMVPFVEGARETGHGSTSCYKCHDSFPGIYKDLAYQLFVSPSSLDIKEKYSGITSDLGLCLECHDLGRITQLNIHNVHYSLFADVLSSCSVCHDIHSPGATEASCTGCHSFSRQVSQHSKFHEYATSELQRGNPAVCIECHSPNAKWGVPLTDECLKGQSMGLTCFDCHTAPLDKPNIVGKSCTQCHGG